MATELHSTRRDPRHELQAGSSWVEFEHESRPGCRLRANLTSLCVSGVGFELDIPQIALSEGQLIEGATLSIANCEVLGDLVVRSVLGRNDAGMTAGCLFYPAAEHVDRWLVLNAGVAAARQG